MLPRSFYFLRHGETDWNKRSVIQGHTDIPLNDTGRAQAASAAPVFQTIRIDRIVSSTLSRAYETAEIINMGLQKPLVADEGLKERNFGALEGASVEEMEKIRREMAENGHPCEENGYPCPAGGEPYADFRIRTMATITHYLNNFPDENILFIAHGGVYRVLRRCLFTDLDHSPNSTPFYFEKQGDIWRLSNLS